MKYAFLTRHTASAEQVALAAERGIELVPIGDRDAFTVTCADVAQVGEFDGVIVVHPAAALRLSGKYRVGVFENQNRAAPGEKPTFLAVALHVFDHRDGKDYPA